MTTPRSTPFDTAVPIGRGASGEVFKAWDPRLRRWAAVKVLASSDPEHAARLQREARDQARVRHPNVAEVYEVGSWDGRPYIAMRWVEGVPIDQAARELPLEGRARLIATVARAVHEAHRVGLIHRDLKPSNILVERHEDGTLVPYVLDFGIAREAHSRGETMTGQVLGTPGFLSPEQARGETTSLDRRSDVFSLGVLLYLMLTGKAPFAAASPAEAWLRVLHDEPERPRRLDGRLPRDLETIVLACLEKDPDRRYASARELADDLDRFLEGTPIAARSVGPAARALRRIRRHPVATVLASAAVAAVVILTVVALYSRWASAAQAAAALRFGERVQRIDSWMRLAHLAPLHDVRTERELVREEMERLRTDMARLGRPARGPGLYALGRGHLALAEEARAVEVLERAWLLDYRAGDVAQALGRAYAGLFREELDAIGRLAGPDVREARLRSASERFQEPARRYLDAAGRVGAVDDGSGSYLAGLLAFLGRDRDRALDAAANAALSRPYFHEAQLLAGDIWLRSAQEAYWSDDAATARAELAHARRHYEEAAATARSDPRVHTARCSAAALAAIIELDAGTAPSSDLLESARPPCADALLADPAGVDPRAALAHAAWRLGQEAMRRGQDPTVFLEEAASLAADGLAVAPGDRDLAQHLGMAHQLAGEYRTWQSAEDPLPHFVAAVAVLEEATRAAPDDGALWKVLGDAQQRRAYYLRDRGDDPLPDLEAARHAYERVRDTPHFPDERLLPSLGGLAIEVAWAKVQRGVDPQADLDRAAEMLERAVEILPARSGAQSNLGLLHWTRAEWEAASGGDPRSSYHSAAAAYQDILARQPDRSYARVPLLGIRESEARYRLSQGEDVSALLAAAELDLAALPDSEMLSRSYFAATFENLRARAAMQRGDDPARALERAERAGRERLAATPDQPSSMVPLAEALRLRAEWNADRNACAASRDAALRGLEVVAAALRINPRFSYALVHQAALERALASCAAGGPEAATLERARATFARALEIQPTLLDPLRAQLGLPPFALSTSPTEPASVERSKDPANR